jgi:cytochrome c-type biogenesis protein
VLAYVTRAHEKRQALSLAAVFIVGLVLTHIVLGVAAASGGDWVKHVMGREWGLLLGPLLILLGMIWAGWLKLRLPWIALRGRRVTGHWGAFLLSIPFSVAICPFCAPALLVMLTTSASIGSVVFGAALLLSFALGRSIPILLGAWSMGWLESLQVVGKHHHVVEMFGGVVLILSGFYMLNEYRYLM